jgi:hypothetical protein
MWKLDILILGLFLLILSISISYNLGEHHCQTTQPKQPVVIKDITKKQQLRYFNWIRREQGWIK